MNALPGDVALLHGKGPVESAIRWAETRRYGKWSPEANWNHAALVVSADGDLIEARTAGLRTLSKGLGLYLGDRSSTVLVVRPPYGGANTLNSELIRYGSDAAIHWATTRLAEREKYGFFAIASICLAWSTQTKLRFGLTGEAICSGFVSQALEFGGIDMGDDPQWNSPADILHIALAGKWPVVV